MPMRLSSLIRGFSRLDSEGKIALPKNILIAMDLKEKDIVELKIVTTGKAKKVTISKRQNFR